MEFIYFLQGIEYLDVMLVAAVTVAGFTYTIVKG